MEEVNASRHSPTDNESSVEAKSTVSSKSARRATLPQIDGPIEHDASSRRKRLGGDVCVVFVHAGAGYHSVANERTHLAACEDAAKAATRILNVGGSAVDAVEIAIKVLEDREITNSGFGSNLTMDGNVECDATLVDHYGRSGAVGAVPRIRNPIHLARLILDQSTKPLSLKRVPPNLIVGPGATELAAELGLPVLHPDLMISPAAGERYGKWRADLERLYPASEEVVEEANLSNDIPSDDQTQTENRQSDQLELLPCWNESQPYSPSIFTADKEPLALGQGSTSASIPTKRKRSCSSFETKLDAQADTENHNDGYESNIDESAMDSHKHTPIRPLFDRKYAPDHISSSTATGDERTSVPAPPPPTRVESPVPAVRPDFDGLASSRLSSTLSEDSIQDTVGAIAIDRLGNIAAGSSSGGIGMKHRGRVGPAALVNIGTAIVPICSEDKRKTCVATVTSGTGEHMATTSAAGTLADRLYTTTRRNKFGSLIVTDEDTSVRSFIERDFMEHPSIKNSHSIGAIGVLGVKKTMDGVTLYFAHNTDSFAVASMSGDDKEPRSVMSRNNGNSQVVNGARRIKHRHFPSIHPETWPINPVASLDPMYNFPKSPSKPSRKKEAQKDSPPKRKKDHSPLDDVAVPSDDTGTPNSRV